MRYCRRILAVGAILILIAGLVAPLTPSTPVQAGPGDPDYGQLWDPIYIDTCEELQAINDNLTGSYIMTDDIDCNGYGFQPIGESGQFSGTLNGQGYGISNLEVPLFSYLSGGVVANVHIDSAHIITSSASYSGILARSSNNSLVANVHTSGTMQLTQNFSYNGGLIGAASTTTIRQSSAVVAVEAAGGQLIYGGLVASMNNSQVVNSYAVTTVSGAGNFEHIGGIASNDFNSDIINSYAAGSFSGVAIHEAGGLVWSAGSTRISNSFSVVEDSGTCGPGSCSGFVTTGGNVELTNDYFDQTAAGTSECSAIIGVTCNAVNTDGSEPNYFDNNDTNPPLNEWDFVNIWQTTLGLPTLNSASLAAPGPVEDLTASIGSTQSVELAWSMPNSTGSAPILGQAVYYQKAGETTWQPASGVTFNPGSTGANFTDTSLLVGNLMPATQYTFQVVFYNEDGGYSTASVQGVTATPGTFVVNSCQDLQNMDADLTGNYELGRNIDCSDTINWNGGLGFKPIACTNDTLNFFAGVLQGNNYTISDIYIAQPCFYYMGIFAGTGQALIQDVNIVNPKLVSPVQQGFKAVLSGVSAQTTFNNVHISGDFIGEDEAIGASVVGVSYGGDTFNQTSFTGSVETTSNQPWFGGLTGYTANYFDVPTKITNSYAQVDVTVTPSEDQDPSAAAFGGLVAAYEGAGLQITNSYAAFTLTQPDVTKPVLVGGLIGSWAPGSEFPQPFATNSFASTQVDADLSIEGSAFGGLAGYITDYGGEGGANVDLAGNYFDADRLGTTLCAGEPSDNLFRTANCNPISGQPGYFENNSTNPPLNTWDFTNIWATTSTFPVFSENAHNTINPIPPERLQPKNKDDPKREVTHTASSNIPPAGVATHGEPGGGSGAATTQEPGGIINRLKEFFNRIPAAVLEGFPYFLFALLLLVAFALFIEMLRQRSRLQELKVLLAEQQAVAEKRDTFWHLAANYLRAPITLLMGGADLLALDKVSGTESAQLTSTSKRLQSKVTDIMSQIEKSRSLQDIQAPASQKPPRVWLSAGFLIPVLAVAALIAITNYLAHAWRNLQFSTITLVSQILIFLLVALVLYWALGAFGVASRKRREAEALLAEQEQALDRARMKLMDQTATELDTDVSRLQLLLAKLSTGSQAKPIMQEGATRLRHLVDSFQLLISAQNHRLGGLSPTGAHTHLGRVLDSCIADLQPEITAKNLQVSLPSQLNLQIPGSRDLNTQLLSSVLANAVAFSPAGSTVNLYAEQNAGGDTRLLIGDHGAGIATAEEAHIFEPFTKADGQAALQLDHGGLGINLYLDRQLMDYLGGEILIHSIPGEGTTVELQWPRTVAAQAQANATAASAAPTA